MDLVDKKVFVIATRKLNNDSWETSGATYGNLVDANATADGLAKVFSGEVKVFVFDRAREVINVEMNYKEPDR
ncbi:hypothetical protein J5E41_11610 [Staphylococcus epidermidis]|uniref:Uncharacterized protein n=1 Tax=Leuconostoc phage P965 TaxID=2662299 RepID=A0A649V2M9_9CAUD|nr:hypothetical protein [Staphylococcus epidermidis]YP_010080362.1 hypothetical protein KMC75_gp29 [Leuconostoc phage P965]MBO3043171.1 hypothetical protein [Staphylococcus epidermidis]QGJ85077.1 hypothetical protein [Leuconostoc phage P965]